MTKKKANFEHTKVKDICYLYERKYHGRCPIHNKKKPKSKINQGKRNDLK